MYSVGINKSTRRENHLWHLWCHKSRCDASPDFTYKTGWELVVRSELLTPLDGTAFELFLRTSMKWRRFLISCLPSEKAIIVYFHMAYSVYSLSWFEVQLEMIYKWKKKKVRPQVKVWYLYLISQWDQPPGPHFFMWYIPGTAWCPPIIPASFLCLCYTPKRHSRSISQTYTYLNILVYPGSFPSESAVTFDALYFQLFEWIS